MEAAFVFVESHLWQIRHTLVTLHQIALWKHKVTAKAGTSYLCSMNVTRVSALMTRTYTMIDGYGSLEYRYCTERGGGRKSSS